MKTDYFKKAHLVLRISILILICFLGNSVHGQVTEQENDTIKKGYAVGALQLENPASVIEAYSYDPVTDKYIYTKTKYTKALNRFRVKNKSLFLYF